MGSKTNKKTLFFLLFLYSVTGHSITFANVPYQACFTPAQQCTPLIVDAINNSKHTILVQAYSFTSAPILKALQQAHNRGVDVRVILDKGQVGKKGRYTSATFLRNAGIPTWVDYKVAIAHNKVMIFDGTSVLTGSFNFTRAAEEHNAENFIIIRDEELTKQYADNWESRAKKSNQLF